jgi:hypothetical protein
MALQLSHPFQITPRLKPGIKLGDGGWLSLSDVFEDGDREAATFILDMPEGIWYVDRQLRSGVSAFHGTVEIFNTFLSFLEAAVESYQWQIQNPGRIGENTTLFPIHVVEWAALNLSEIEMARMDMQDLEGNPRELLALEI